MTDDLIETMRAEARRGFANGFLTAGEVTDKVVEMLSDEADDPDALARLAPEVVARVEVAFRHEQAGWPALTDCDRLDTAFTDLNTAGIVARHDFSCCGNCGAAEIWDEVEAARAQDGAESGPPRGYTFYHMQDTERAAEGGGLYLAYGAVQDGEAASIAVGQEIVRALRARGLSVDWDGSPARRIEVPLDWKRRTGTPIGRTSA